MITLSITLFVYTITGWIIRKIDAKKGKYKFDPFDECPTLFSATLLLTTVFCVINAIFLCIKYLP